ncbi:MAG: hypothetical protein AAF697_12735 [Pseudomonadota bacterium]
MRLFVKAAISFATAMFAVQPALASDKSSGSFQVGARIPVVCTLETGTFRAEEGATVVTGSMFEACNTNRGFQIIATHRVLEQDERIRVRYGTSSAQLHPTGFSFVTTRSGARYGRVPVRIEPQQLNQPISISFSLSAV